MASDSADWRARFWTGFTTPSVTALAAASATVMAMAVLSAAVVGPGLLTDGNVRWFAFDPLDDAAFVTARLYDLDRFPPGGVVLIGGSGLRESLVDTPTLASRLSKAAGRDVPVVDLVMDGQTIIESAALAAEVDTPSVLLLGLSPVRFQYTADDMIPALRPPRLGLTNDVLAEELGRIGWSAPTTTGVPMVDYSRLYATRLPNIPTNVLIGGHEQRVHAYLGIHPLPPEEIDEDWQARIRHLREEGPAHREVFDRMVERAKKAGHTVLLYRGPLRTDIFGTEEEATFFDEYRDIADEIAKTHDLAQVTVTAAQLEPTDFADPVHINNTAAQDRLTTVITEQLVRHLERP